MASRGRNSAASLAVSTPVGLVTRPQPPLDLTPPEADEWAAVANTMPADWFGPETHGLLRQYCRHVVAAGRVAMLIEYECARDEIDVGALDKLFGMQARESASIKASATALRLTHQARYTAQRAATAKAIGAVKRIWER